MYSDFVFLDRFLFELLCKNTHTQTHTHTHTDSNKYPIVAFSKNATITMIFIQIVYKQRMLISDVLKWVGLKMHLFGFQTTYYHADTS